MIMKKLFMIYIIEQQCLSVRNAKANHDHNTKKYVMLQRGRLAAEKPTSDLIIAKISQNFL